MKRSGPLKRRIGLTARPAEPGGYSTLPRSRRLRPVSPKRAEESRGRRAMAARRRWADNLHEPLTRTRSGGIADEDNQTPACRPCHDVLTFRPETELAWAYALGLLVHSWEARSA